MLALLYGLVITGAPSIPVPPPSIPVLPPPQSTVFEDIQIMESDTNLIPLKFFF